MTYNQMMKIRKATTINLPRGNHAKCPIYKYKEKFYIKANKPNTSAYIPFYYNNEEYSEVECIYYDDKEIWFLK